MVSSRGQQVSPMTEDVGSGRVHNDWVEEYVDYARDDGIPLIFTKWGAISAIAAALERRVYCRVAGRPPLYPNLFIMLVSPPAVGKSSTISPIRDMMLGLKRGNESKLKLGPMDFSKASLLDFMESNKTVVGIEAFAHIYLALDELGTGISFLDNGLMTFLSKLFDADLQAYDEQKRSRGPKIPHLPFPIGNILTGVQPGYLAANVPELAWQQGLMARFIMVYSGKIIRKRSVWASVARAYQKRRTLQQDLQHIFNLEGEVVFSEESKPVWEEYECDRYWPTHPKLQNFAGRRGMFLAKLATISSVSRGMTKMIEAFDVERAHEWLTEAEDTMPLVFKNMVGTTDEMVMHEILYDLRREPGIKNGVPLATLVQLVTQRVKTDKAKFLIQAMNDRGDIRIQSSDLGPVVFVR